MTVYSFTTWITWQKKRVWMKCHLGRSQICPPCPIFLDLSMFVREQVRRGLHEMKGLYHLNDIRTVACCRVMEIWVPKEGSRPTSERIETVWAVCRWHSPKDECTVKLEDLEKEWWADTELGLLRVYHFPWHVTESDGSVGHDGMSRAHLDDGQVHGKWKNRVWWEGDEFG